MFAFLENFALFLAVSLFFYLVLSQKFDKTISLFISFSSAFFLVFLLREFVFQLFYKLIIALLVFFFVYVIYGFYFTVKQYDKRNIEKDFYKGKFLKIFLALVFLWVFIDLFKYLDVHYLIKAFYIFFILLIVFLAIYYFLKG